MYPVEFQEINMVLGFLGRHTATQPTMDASVVTVTDWGGSIKGIPWLRLLRVDHHCRVGSSALVDMIIALRVERFKAIMRAPVTGGGCFSLMK